MIRLVSMNIRNFRGIRDLELQLGKKSFAVQGPNGSGKSGVVDAIEFVLTGNISRLSGPGTKDLTTTRHGPHVDFRDDPREAVVTLVAEIATSGKTITLKRKLDKPHLLSVTPDTDQMKAVAERISAHPEFVLSRRQIIKYILIEAGKRADEIQALLKLERIKEMRQALRTAANSFSKESTAADSAHATAVQAVKSALGIEDLTKEALLARVNELRKTAGVDLLEDISATIAIDRGINDDEGDEKKKSPSKKIAHADRTAFLELFSTENPTAIAADAEQLLEKLEELREDQALLGEVEKQQLFELALKFFDGEKCPVCDTEWEREVFKEIIAAKKQRIQRAQELKRVLNALVLALATRADALISPLSGLCTLAEQLGRETIVERLQVLKTSLEATKTDLKDREKIFGLTTDDLTKLTALSEDSTAALTELEAAIETLPDETGRGEARKILNQTEPRLKDARESSAKKKQAKANADKAQLALTTYDTTVDEFLNGLYQNVENNFADYYRTVNGHDEAGFKAQLHHEAGSVGLNVDFYGRGLFPPVAYHSEGHQDGMGLCLYLALMQQVLGAEFTFAVLDDVVMSVDSKHRKEVCSLLRQQFPDTQFIITTHDKVWLHQMFGAKLVNRRSSIRFTKWSVEDGPLTAENKDAWEKIQERLDNDDVEEAAAILRRYLESVSLEIAELIGAEVPLRQDGDYELGEVFPKVISRWKRLLEKAAKSAKSWQNAEAQEENKKRVEHFTKCHQATEDDRWALNKMVHYNAWANLSKEDCAQLVQAYRDLLDCFCCPSCSSLLHPEPSRAKTNTLRCDCGAISLNLQEKK